MGHKDKSPQIPDVKVPSLSDLSNSAIQANITNLPKLLDAFKQYGPGYAQSINDIFKQSQSRLQELYPEQYGVMSGLSKNITSNLNFLSEAGGVGLPQPITDYARNQLRSAQAARGIAESPAAAFSEANALAPLAENFRSSVTGEAQDFLNGKQLLAPGSVQGLDTLGLSPISNTDLFGGAIDQTEMDQNNQYMQFALKQQQYNNQIARKQNTAKALGMLTGGIGGGIYGATNGLGFIEGTGYGIEGGMATAKLAAGGTYF